jgi:hypothetical protein
VFDGFGPFCIICGQDLLLACFHGYNPLLSLRDYMDNNHYIIFILYDHLCVNEYSLMCVSKVIYK